MASWSFLTGHARDPGARPLDIEASAGITDRSASGPVTGAAEAGYIVKHKDSRRNRYQIQALPLPGPGSPRALSARNLDDNSMVRGCGWQDAKVVSLSHGSLGHHGREEQPGRLPGDPADVW